MPGSFTKLLLSLLSHAGLKWWVATVLPRALRLRDRCITAMLATLVPVRKDRDTKVELNHRSQACEVLADTCISRRRNGYR